LSIFRESLEKIQVALKSDNSGYFTSIPMYGYDNISLNSPHTKAVQNIKTHFRYSIISSPKIVPFMIKCIKVRHSDRSHMWLQNTRQKLRELHFR